MSLSPDDLAALCSVAQDAARQAGQMIRQRSGMELEVHEKEGGTSRASQVVTEVDYQSQTLILEILAPTLKAYDLGMLIEESDDDGSRFEKDYFWCVDPLDGTLPFIEQRPGYSVSIALVSRDGVACIGVVYDPREDVMYHAVSGAGAFRNESRWSVETDYVDSFEAVESGGSVMNACWVLERAPAAFVKYPKTQRGGGCLWDYAATACLFQEIGAVVSDSRGRPLDLNARQSLYMNQKGIVYATHQAIADRLIDR